MDYDATSPRCWRDMRSVADAPSVSGVYALRHKLKGRIYVGQSNCIAARLTSHYANLRNLAPGTNPEMLKDAVTDGADCFEWCVLEAVDESRITAAELRWYTTLNASVSRGGYNLAVPQATWLQAASPRPVASTHALQNPHAYALPPQRKGKRDDGTVRRMDVPREQLNVRIRPELKRAAASLAGLQGLTLGDVVEAALIEYITAHQSEVAAD